MEGNVGRSYVMRKKTRRCVMKLRNLCSQVRPSALDFQIKRIFYYQAVIFWSGIKPQLRAEVCCRPLTAEARIRAWVCPCGIYWCYYMLLY
jgi:hypothetical protein